MSRSLALIVAAGTGGHLYPGIAVARAIRKKPDWDVLFVVRDGDMGKTLLEREGWRVESIAGQGMPRGISWKWLTFPFRLMGGVFQSLRLLRRVRPTVVIGMGGYLSFSAIGMARLLGIRTLIHEQNVLPGLTNRIVARWADSIAVSFPESESYFPSKKVWVSGLPLRAEIVSRDRAEARRAFGLQPTLPTVLVFGGSLGAHKMNQVALQTWKRLEQERLSFQVLHITGPNDFTEMQSAYKELSIPVHVLAYSHDMPSAYAAADVIVCRAGASTIAELCMVEKPAILVPYPFAAEDHQLFNAEVLMKRFVAEVILDKDLEPEVLSKRLRPYLQSEEKAHQVAARWKNSDLRQMHAQAASRVAERATQSV